MSTAVHGEAGLDRSGRSDRLRRLLESALVTAGALGLAAAVTTSAWPPGMAHGRATLAAAALAGEALFWWTALVALAALRLAPYLLYRLEPALARTPAACGAALRPLATTWAVAGAIAVGGYGWWGRPERAAAALLLSGTLLGLLASGWRLRALARGPLAVSDRGPHVAAAAVLLGFVLLPSWPAPQGDEPHYLLVVESLLHDHDLDLAREYGEGVYRKFHPEPLSPHYKPGLRPGSRYSMHGVGYPLLLLPAYAAGEALGPGRGVMAARAMQLLLYGAFLLALYRLVESLVGRRGALFGTLTAGLMSPLAWAPLQLFPETPAMAAACAAAWAAWRGGARREFGAGLVLAALPWLGVKYLPIATVLALGLPWVRADRRPAGKTLLRLALPLASACVAHAAFTWTLYGSLSPAAVYLGADPGFARQPGYGNRWGAYLADWPGALRTLAGYFLDGKEGLLAVGPQWLIACLGLPWLAKRHRRWLILVALLLAAHLGPYALSQQAGGQGPPARPVMAVLWALAVPLAAGLALPARGVGALAKGALLVAGVGVTAALGADPTRLPHDYGVAASWLWRDLSPAGAGWAGLWPVYLGARGVGWGAPQLFGLVLACVSAFLLVRAGARGRGAVSRLPSLPAWGAAAYASVGLLLLGLVSAAAVRSDRHVGGEVAPGVRVWIPASVPARAWVEGNGVWIAPGRPVDLLVQAPVSLAGTPLWLRTLVSTPVRLLIEGEPLSATLQGGGERRVRWPEVPGRAWSEGGVVYRVRAWAERGAAPADIEGGADRRVLGLHLRWQGAPGGEP